MAVDPSSSNAPSTERAARKTMLGSVQFEKGAGDMRLMSYLCLANILANASRLRGDMIPQYLANQRAEHVVVTEQRADIAAAVMFNE